MKRVLLFLISLFLLNAMTYAQTSCGAIINDTYKQYELKKSISPVYPEKVYKQLDITLFIFAEDSNQYVAYRDSFIDSIAAVNDAFKPIELSFVVCSTAWMQSHMFRTIRNEEREEQEMMILFTNPGTINMYCVDNVSSGGGEVGGYAAMPFGGDHVVLAKSATSKVVIHELGHFFGLYHTHESATYGAEFVDGSNCATAGDRFCDTPADFNLANAAIASDCSYPQRFVDGHGEVYAPTVANYMSYSSDQCKCNFTREQYRKMAQMYFAARTDLR